MNLSILKEAAQLREYLTSLIANAPNTSLHFSVVTNVRERIIQIAHNIENSNISLSRQLLAALNSMFVEQPVNWNVSVFTANPIAFGAEIALLDVLISEGQKSEEDIWRFIHPAVCKSSKKLYMDGNYANSAVDAFIEIVSRVKKIYKILNPSIAKVPDGTDLMQKIFSSDSSAFLRVCELDSQIGNDTQSGFRFMMAGAISALRNPKSHSNDEQVSAEDAMRRLMFASMLMYKIDEALALSNIHEQ